MISKILPVIALAMGLQVATANKAAAQKATGTTYINAVGMRLEVGSDFGTLVGISGKHFFDKRNAGEAQVTFGNRLTLVEMDYQYHGDVPNAQGLKWYAGGGAGAAFAKKYSGYDYYEGYYYGSGGTDFLLRPVAGLDYKINNVPINFSFDWRPAFVVTHGTSFTAARFGFGFRYAF